MNLWDLPLSTSMSEVEKRIVRAFLGHTGACEDVYRRLAQSLHLKVEEIKAIEKAMVLRLNAANETPVPTSEYEYGHGAILAMCESVEKTD